LKQDRTNTIKAALSGLQNVPLKAEWKESIKRIERMKQKSDQAYQRGYRRGYLEARRRACGEMVSAVVQSFKDVLDELDSRA